MNVRNENDDRESGRGFSATTITKRLTRLSPFQCGRMFGAMFFIVGLVYAATIIIFDDHPRAGVVRSLGMGLIVPVAFATAGLVKGLIVAILFNIASAWTGGIEYDTSVETKRE